MNGGCLTEILEQFDSVRMTEAQVKFVFFKKNIFFFGKNLKICCIVIDWLFGN